MTMPGLRVYGDELVCRVETKSRLVELPHSGFWFNFTCCLRKFIVQTQNNPEPLLVPGPGRSAAPGLYFTRDVTALASKANALHTSSVRSVAALPSCGVNFGLVCR
jgi:hypothetical protein